MERESKMKTVKMYNSVGCSISGIEESKIEDFKKAGWISEQEYKDKKPEELHKKIIFLRKEEKTTRGKNERNNRKKRKNHNRI